MALQNLQKAVDMENDLKELKQVVATLQHEVERLRDVEAVRDLLWRYASDLEHEWTREGIVHLFSDAPGTHVQYDSGRWKGKDGVRRFLKSGRPAALVATFGLPRIDLFEDLGPDGKTLAVVRGLGMHRVHCIKEGDELWRFWSVDFQHEETETFLKDPNGPDEVLKELQQLPTRSLPYR